MKSRNDKDVSPRNKILLRCKFSTRPSKISTLQNSRVTHADVEYCFHIKNFNYFSHTIIPCLQKKWFDSRAPLFPPVDPKLKLLPSTCRTPVPISNSYLPRSLLLLDLYAWHAKIWQAGQLTESQLGVLFRCGRI